MSRVKSLGGGDDSLGKAERRQVDVIGIGGIQQDVVAADVGLYTAAFRRHPP